MFCSWLWIKLSSNSLNCVYFYFALLLRLLFPLWRQEVQELKSWDLKKGFKSETAFRGDLVKYQNPEIKIRIQMEFPWCLNFHALVEKQPAWGRPGFFEKLMEVMECDLHSWDKESIGRSKHSIFKRLPKLAEGWHGQFPLKCSCRQEEGCGSHEDLLNQYEKWLSANTDNHGCNIKHLQDQELGVGIQTTECALSLLH